MFEIPMILYLSDSYKNISYDLVSKIENSLEKPFNTQHLIHCIIELSHLYNEDFEKNFCIFNSFAD